LSEGSSVTTTLFFPGAPVGGRVIWGIDGHTLEVPVPALGEGAQDPILPGG
jgi:hypothetical protein